MPTPTHRRTTLRLTPRDGDVLDALASYRFLSAPQAASLFFPSEGAASTRLRALHRAGLCTQVFVPVRPNDRSSKTVWALSGRGARHVALRHDGVLPRFLTDREHRSGLFLDHTLRRNDLRVALEALDRDHPGFALLAWRQTPEAVGSAAVVRLTAKRTLRVPVVPDGLAHVRWRGEVHALLVEIDMGTVPLRRMFLRYRAYWRAWADGLARMRWGAVPTRVLTLTTTPTRLAALRAAAMRAPESGTVGSRLFWFAQLDVADLTRPERLLGPHWLTAAQAETPFQSLFT